METIMSLGKKKDSTKNIQNTYRLVERLKRIV